MKKLLLIALFAFFTFFANAQNGSTNTRKYDTPFIESYFMAFHTTDTQLGQLGFLRLGCNDDMSNIWLRCEIITPYNVAELVDENGRRTIGQYTIPENKKLYIKLDNDSIVTLNCNYVSKIHSGYYNSGTDIYYKYNMYCYFDLNKIQIEQLNDNKIAKIRGEFKYDVMDLKVSDKDQSNFSNAYQELQSKADVKRIEDNKQKKINNNPLDGF